MFIHETNEYAQIFECIFNIRFNPTQINCCFFLIITNIEYYNKVILQNNAYCVNRLYEYHKIIILLFNFKKTYLSILIV